MTLDGVIHLLRIARLDELLRAGQLFPRWMPQSILGLGYPLLNYYAAAGYYLVELAHLTGLPLFWSFLAVQTGMVWMAAVGMYLLARDVLGRGQSPAALVAAIAYAYGPYLLTNIYVRGALAELGAQALLPWVLWSFRRLWAHRRPGGSMAPAMLLATLACTHTVSLLLQPILLLTYVGLLWRTAPGRRRATVATLLAIGGAMVLSCFFWLPLVLERGLVSQVGYQVAREHIMPQGFLELKDLQLGSLRYVLHNDLRYRLGLLQLAGAAAGLWVVAHEDRYRTPEWRFWIAVLLVSGALMTRLAEPLWYGLDAFAVIQSPSRLQTLFQLPVALLTALPIARLRPGWARLAGACALSALLIYAHAPQMPWARLLWAQGSRFDMPANAYYEVHYKDVVAQADVLTTVQEFRPRWAASSLRLDPASVPDVPEAASVDPGSDAPSVAVVAADPFGTRLVIEATGPKVLRFSHYYFPGWRAVADGQQSLAVRPSTNLGLVTVDVPPGRHTLRLTWSGTAVERWAGVISLWALWSVLVWQARCGRPWPLVVATIAAVAVAGARLTGWGDASPTKVARSDRLEAPGVQLVGWQGPTLAGSGVAVHPYWHVTRSAPADFRVRWQIHDAAGSLVLESVSAPYYDSYSALHLPADTVFDDHHLLELPPGSPAGEYRVTMRLLGTDAAAESASLEVGRFRLPKATPVVDVGNELDVRFGDAVRLAGYRVGLPGQLSGTTRRLESRPDVLRLAPGDALTYTLYWRTSQEIDRTLVGLVHLVDSTGGLLAQRDQATGPILMPTDLWTTRGVYPDRYFLRIPSDTPSGVYWPMVGMYDLRDVRLFPVRQPPGGTVTDLHRLPPVKVVAGSARPRGEPVGIRFGNTATLSGFEIEGGTVNAHGAISVTAGSTLTLTAWFRAEAPDDASLKRFVQVRDPDDRIVAQNDGEPQGGNNPTWSWVPGEIVEDRVELAIPRDARAAGCRIFLGLYDDTDPELRRLPATDSRGDRLPGDEATLQSNGRTVRLDVVALGRQAGRDPDPPR